MTDAMTETEQSYDRRLTENKDVVAVVIMTETE